MIQNKVWNLQCRWSLFVPTSYKPLTQKPQCIYTWFSKDGMTDSEVQSTPVPVVICLCQLTLSLESHSPCCRERWSWRCRPDQHQQKAGPPQQCVECSLHGPQGWSQGFCSAPDGCCLHPECSRGYRDRPGTPLRPCSQWSSLHQTDLGTEENRRIFKRYQTGHVWFCQLNNLITYHSAKRCILWTLLLSQQPAHACFGSHGEPDRWR